MSNRKLIDPSIVTGIADAIRNKKGTTATIKVSELADEIASIQTMAQSTKDLVNAVSGVTPTDEISLNNGIASGVADAPSVHSWADTRTTADGGTIKDGIAYVKALRGKSIKVAQLANLNDNKNHFCPFTKEGNVFHCTTSGTYSEHSVTMNGSTITGHKYLLWYRIKNTSSASATFILGFAPLNSKAVSSPRPTIASGASYQGAFIVTETADQSNGVIGTRVTYSGAGFTFDCEMMSFDLTAMGIDTYTADEVAQYLGFADAASMGYVPFTDGVKVLNCKQKSVKSYGVELLTSSATQYAAYINNDSKRWIASGDSASYCFPCKPNSIVRINAECSDINTLWRVGYVTTETMPNVSNSPTLSGVVEKRNTNSFDYTTGEGATFVIVQISKTFVTNHFADISVLDCGTQIDTLTLPTLTAFPHGLCGVGTAYDEVDLAEGKAIKRMGRKVFDASENWGFTDTYSYTFNLTNSKRSGAVIGELPSAITSARMSDNNAAFLIYYPSGTYASKAELQSAMSGAVVYYELATAEESTFTPCRAYYKASNNGQETATAEEATAPFTAEIGYKEPTATELVNALNG